MRRVGEMPRKLVVDRLYPMFDSKEWKIRWVAAELILKMSDSSHIDEFMTHLGHSKGMSITEVAHLAYISPTGLPPGMPMGLEGQARYTPSSPITWSNSCHACVCEVDAVTGAVAILRFVVSEDCGVMINPDVVEGQIAGGVVQGIGGVLYEHMPYDADGNPLSTTFVDYLLPTAAEVPIVEYGHIETPAPTNPGGFKGMGEGGAIGSPPAVINAVADAIAHLGARVNRQPLSPGVIIAAIEEAASS